MHRDDIGDVKEPNGNARGEESMSDSPLWRLLAGARSRDELAAALVRISDAELRSACVEYFQSRADVVFAMQENGKAAGASEDILDDVAEAVLRKGHEAYEAVLRGEGELPDRTTWSTLERETLRGTFMNAWERRFSEDLFEAVANG